MSNRPDADAIRAWMRENRAGYAEAAEHFSLSTKGIKALMRGPPPHARADVHAQARAQTSAREADEDEDRIPDPPVRPFTSSDPCELCGHDEDAAVLARWRVGLSPLDWALDKHVQIEEVLARLTTAAKLSGQAIAALVSRTTEAKHLVTRILSNAGPLTGANPGEVTEYLRRIAEDAEDEHLELWMTVYAERHNGKIWFIGDSGHRAELDPETGWQEQAG